ncbi:MAG: hypothetical protein HOM11_00785 [Methylococcales bacterium]|jgi:hypothetical protein|nr:hypothetical protein [Methylococcales bacterium]MBT7443159.1 hypothetical protein [Methylococcales bacterium]
MLPITLMLNESIIAKIGMIKTHCDLNNEPFSLLDIFQAALIEALDQSGDDYNANH